MPPSQVHLWIYCGVFICSHQTVKDKEVKFLFSRPKLKSNGESTSTIQKLGGPEVPDKKEKSFLKAKSVLSVRTENYKSR